MDSLLWSFLGSHRFPRELSSFLVWRFFTLSSDDRLVLRRRFRSRESMVGVTGFEPATPTSRRCKERASNNSIRRKFTEIHPTNSQLAWRTYVITVVVT